MAGRERQQRVMAGQGKAESVVSKGRYRTAGSEPWKSANLEGEIGRDCRGRDAEHVKVGKLI